MQIVEYKKHLVDDELKDPEWVVRGSLLYNPLDKTYIGFVLDEEDREYYLPDTVSILTEEEVVIRSLSIHESQPYKAAHIPGEPDLTEDQVREMVISFI